MHSRPAARRALHLLPRPTPRVVPGPARGPALGLTLGLALLAFAAPPSAVEAQDAAAFLEEARNAYEARMEGIVSYTVTSAVGGAESTTRHVRREVDGAVVFVPESMDERAAQEQQTVDPSFFYRAEIAERMRIEGMEEVDGTTCRWIILDDFEGIDFNQAMGGMETSAFQPTSMRMCIDPEQYVLRKMDLEGTVNAAGTTSDFATSMLLTDYRNVDGVLHPFRVEMGGTGAGPFGGGGSAPGSAMMEQLQNQLESLPESQRKMIEDMMKDRMAAMGEMAGGNLVVETRSIEVNRGG